MRIMCCITTIVLSVVVLPVGAAAQSVTLDPVKDTYVQSTNPDSNFGVSEDLWLGKGSYFGLGIIRGLVEFDLSSLPSDPNQIISATFSAYQYDTEPAAGDIDTFVHRCTTAWDENTATWNNQPSIHSTTWAVAGVGNSFYTGWIDWDVTDLVRAQASGQYENKGWMFKVQFETAGVSRLGYFRSSEYVADPTLRPVLVVEVEGGVPGDMNCDGVLDVFDIDPFVLALTDPAGYAAAWPNCNILNGDINGDGLVDAFDIDPFVALLIGP